MKSVKFSQAVEGYKLYFEAQHRSPHTLSDYMNTYKRFKEFLGNDPDISTITHQQIQKFLASRSGVSEKTVLNYHCGLSVLWTWAISEGLVKVHIIHKVERPTYCKKVIVPFSEEEIRGMLAVISRSKSYVRPGKTACQNTLPSADRNRAIILLLLDTGMRASELCDIHTYDVDWKQRQIKLLGKGNKERIVPFSSRTGQAIWKYMATRTEDKVGDYLFIGKTDKPLDRTELYKMLDAAGKKAGIQSVHPHRFRHTFAIMYLRNGGDAYTLQKLLGHTTLDMVRNYISLAQTDLQAVHRRASPVDNMSL